jgi:hypothetical protein
LRAVRFIAASAGAALVLPAAATAACGLPGYSYAGFQHVRAEHGVRATLVAIAQPAVESGHVAAFVGVGGPGQGAGGTDVWIQVGMSAFRGTGSKLYLEVKQAGSGARYTELADGIATGERIQVAVLEMAHRPEWWRVWVNGEAASPPLYLPGSGGRLSPIATSESWDGGRPACNRFAYRFENVGVAAALGGSWTQFVTAYRIEDPGYRVVRQTESVFIARAADWPG